MTIEKIFTMGDYQQIMQHRTTIEFSNDIQLVFGVNKKDKPFIGICIKRYEHETSRFRGRTYNMSEFKYDYYYYRTCGKEACNNIYKYIRGYIEDYKFDPLTHILTVDSACDIEKLVARLDNAFRVFA